MKRIGSALAIAASIMVAAPAGARTPAPTPTDKRNAAKECKAERTAMGKGLFAQKYGGRKNAFGKCVSTRAKDEASERKAARAAAREACKDFEGQERSACVKERTKRERAAADAADKREFEAGKTCRAERHAMGEQAFAEKYGENANDRNAFGTCVAAQTQQAEQEQPA